MSLPEVTRENWPVERNDVDSGGGW